MCKLSPVPFHGDTIFCIDYQNQPFTPMRPIVENMGLDWGGQAVKLKANKERWTVEMISTVAQDGVEREMLSMPVRKLPAWLNSINPKKVRAELRPKIELYQAESDDALWNYWMNGRAEQPSRESVEVSGTLLPPELRSELKGIVDAKLSTYPASVQGKARSEIWTRFNRHFRIAEYAQLPAERMAEARDYLIELEVKALKALPSATPALSPAPTFRTDFPADMHTGRKDALKKIQSLMAGVGAARDVVRLFCHPGGKSMRMTLDEREIYDALYQLYCAADDSLLAAYRALDAGYKLGRQYGRG
jgi:hypothetical protein